MRARDLVLRLLTGRSSPDSTHGPNEQRGDPVGQGRRLDPRDAADAQRAILASPLIRALGLGISQTTGDMTVECISIELRELGGIALLRAFGRDEVHGQPDRPGDVNPTPWVEDNLGTVYRVAMPSWTSDDRLAEMVFWFMPAPPDRATRLTISAPGIPPFATDWLRDRDPWVFAIALDARSGA